ncbi:MAG: MBL fold metallo-hydrolase [Candidatus Limnocylindrales bacterium]
MRLTVVGAGPAYSDDPDSRGACYLVESASAAGAGAGAIVLDLGHGAFASLASRISPSALDAVLVSHLHPDHFVDLVPLRHWLRYHADPAGRIDVHAHRDLPARLDGLHGEPGFAAGTLDLVPLEPGERSIATFRIETVRVRHTADSFAFRIADRAGPGPGLVYSGDVGDARDLEPLIRPGDTLLVECSFGAGPVPSGTAHLDGPGVAELAARTGPASVLLTHILPGQDRHRTLASVRAGWKGVVTIVTPGFTTEI